MLHNPYSSHYQTFTDCANPFKTELTLVPGKQIYINGTIVGDQLKIDFMNTSTMQIAFHFNPRFSQNCVVRNTKTGAWGPEERAGPFPFQKGQPFEIIIFVEEDKYRVAVNGQHAFEYRHRVNYREVNLLCMYGEARFHRVVFSGGASANPNVTHSPAVPFAIPVPGGCTPGRMIQLHGHVKMDAGRFCVHLQNGPQVQPNDIAFTFNPRFDDPYSPEPIVVRVNRRHGGWGGEERDGGSPFSRGGNFEMLILVEPQEFKVAINGQHYCSFKHRNGLHDANHLGVDGDVIIHSVTFF